MPLTGKTRLANPKTIKTSRRHLACLSPRSAPPAVLEYIGQYRRFFVRHNSTQLHGVRRSAPDFWKITQMAILLNGRHEAFAHGLADGKSIDAAYREAGYQPNSGNASRLNGNERVIVRVVELKELVHKMRHRSSRNATRPRGKALEFSERVVGLLSSPPFCDRSGSS